jgi:site-specific DNA-methyltransferase (adenine-specific)
MSQNVLYYGDNLDVLRRHIKNDSVDLVYLDPPFKSNQDYNVLFSEQNAPDQRHRSRHSKIRGDGIKEPQKLMSKLLKLAVKQPKPCGRSEPF